MTTLPRPPSVAKRAHPFQSLETSGPHSSNHWKGLLGVAAIWLGLSLRSSAVVPASETFDVNSAGWLDRDPAEMTVGFAAGFGNPSGSLQGTFASQGSPSFESDAFRVTSAGSGGDFSGNLYLSYTNFSTVEFAFYAEDILPTTFIIRIGDGTNTFLYNLNPQLASAATWTTVSVSLAYLASWLGGSATQFSNLFTSVAFMGVQVGRNGTGVQDYFLDNFTLNFNETLAAVPEPATFGMLLIGLTTLFMIRKRRRAKSAGVADETK